MCVSLRKWSGRVKLQLGLVNAIDVDRRRVEWIDPEGGAGSISYDRLLITVGSVNKLLPIPGVAENAHGFRNIPEALYLRDHMTRQMELAAVSSDAEERKARTTFVVVGAGYTGTELAAQGQLLTNRIHKLTQAPDDCKPRWDAARSGQAAAARIGQVAGRDGRQSSAEPRRGGPQRSIHRGRGTGLGPAHQR